MLYKTAVWEYGLEDKYGIKYIKSWHVFLTIAHAIASASVYSLANVGLGPTIISHQTEGKMISSQSLP